VERLQSCDNIVALSQELGVHRRLLYQWRDQSEAFESAESPPRSSREFHAPEGNQPVATRAGGEDAGGGFFKGALQKVEARTPEQRYDWREGIYDEIQKVMPFARQSEYRAEMCQLARVSRAGFYRSLPRAAPVEERWKRAHDSGELLGRASAALRLSADYG